MEPRKLMAAISKLALENQRLVAENNQLKETMESAAPSLKVNLKVKVHMGPSWGELEEIAVPEGGLEETPGADIDMG